MPRKNIRGVLKTHADELMAVLGVVGVGEGESHGRPCIKVFVTDKNCEQLKRIPNTIEGYPVQIEESGKFRTLGTR